MGLALVVKFVGSFKQMGLLRFVWKCLARAVSDQQAVRLLSVQEAPLAT